MKVLDCAAARRRLDAFQDRELPLGEQIAVAAHLDWCDACAAALEQSREVGALVRTHGHANASLSSDDESSLRQTVLSRVKAEREAGVVARIRTMFDDMHLVYAALGATGATLACLIIMLGMMRFATRERPDSLAAMVNLMASPGSDDNPVRLDSRVTLPRVIDSSYPNATQPRDAEEDAVFTLAAVVTREGRIANLELLHANSEESGDAQLIEGLLNAVSRARFEPASVEGLPVAVNMVWLVAHTTVRASKHTLDLPVLPAKKRAAGLARAITMT